MVVRDIHAIVIFMILQLDLSQRSFQFCRKCRHLSHAYISHLIEGNLKVKLPTIWTDEKAEIEEAEGREEQKREDDRRERVRRKKMQMREKAGKSRNTVFFQ